MGKRKRNTPKKHKTKKTKVRVSDAPISQLNINEDDNNTNNDNSQTSQNEETINNNVKKGKPTITRTLIGSYSWGEKHKIYLPGFPNALKDNYLSVCAGKLESGAATQARSHPNKYFHNVYFEPVQIVLELARRDLKTYDILTDRGNLQRIDAAISSSVGDKDFTLYLRKHNNLLMIKRGGEEFGSNVGHMFEDALCKGSPFASSHVLVQVDVTLPSPSLSSSSSTSSPSSSSNSDPSIPAPNSSTSSSAPSTSSSSSSSESTPTVSSTSSTSSLSPSSPVRLLVRAEIDAASLPFQTPRKKEYKLYKKTESDLHSYIAMHEHPLALTHLREIKMARELNVHHHFQSWLIGVNRIVHGVAKENRKLEKTLKMKDFGDRLAAVTEKLLFYSSQMSEGETYMLERKNYGPLEFSKAGEEQDEPWLQF